MPWLAVFVGGLWIPNLFYWGLNQFITQRTLGAKNLAEGQKGIYLACVFKLCIPFIIIIPGIMAFDLFGPEIMAKADGVVSKAGEQAYPYLISRIMPPFLRGIMLAALAGAVMSTFNSGINSASTIYTIDLYKKYVRPDASTQHQVKIGRYATAIIAILACLLAPLPGTFQGVFAYIQEIWGFISPGIVATFLGGILLPRAPLISGRLVLLIGPLLYAFARVPKWILESTFKVEDGTLLLQKSGSDFPIGGLPQTFYNFHSLSFLHHMAMIFLILMALMIWLNHRRPLPQPVTYPQSDIDIRTHPSTYLYGTLIILTTTTLYILFW